MPSRGSFLKWLLILNHLQNQHPLDDLYEAIPVISSGARRAQSRNLHVGQGQTVRSLHALRLVEMTEGRSVEMTERRFLVEMTDYLGRDDRGALSRDDRRASQERSRSWKVVSKSPVYQGSATSGALSAPASCRQA